jgi:predicted nucleic acid-binding protein
VSFDTGVLIALDRDDARAWAWLKRAVQRREPPLVSAVAVTECWRDGRRQARLARVLHACDVAPVDESLARAAGEALADVPSGATTDALIAATAARAGAVLVTDDVEDMTELTARHFRAVRLAALAGPAR